VQHQDEGAIIAYGGAYGAYAGGMSAWLIGEALESSEEAHRMQGVFPGAAGGAATGATVAYLVGKANPRIPAAVGMLYSGTGMGFYYGEEQGRMLIPPTAPCATERIRAAGLAGTMAGVGLGTALGSQAGTPGHQAHFALATGMGWMSGRGVGDLAQWDRVGDRRLRAAAETDSSVAMGTMAAIANHSDLESPQASTISVAAVDGAWFGDWAPFLFSDDPAGGQLLGGAELGLGYAATVGMTALGQPSPHSVAMQGVGLAAGSALGAGVPLSLGKPGPTRALVSPMLLGGAAGQALGAGVAPHYQVEANDRLLLASVGSWTAYQAVGWSVFARQTGATDSQAVGYALTAGGAGTLATMALVPALDVSPDGSVMMLSGGSWGTWFGAWGSQISGADADVLWLSTLCAGDGALLGTALAQGAGWQPTWRQVAAVDGFGLLGAAAGGLLGTIALDDPNDWTPISTSVVVGSGVGLVTGGILSTLPERQRPTRARLAARLPFRTQVQAAPWASEGGDPGLWLQVDLTER